MNEMMSEGSVDLRTEPRPEKRYELLVSCSNKGTLHMGLFDDVNHKIHAEISVGYPKCAAVRTYLEKLASMVLHSNRAYGTVRGVTVSTDDAQHVILRSNDAVMVLQPGQLEELARKVDSAIEGFMSPRREAIQKEKLADEDETRLDRAAEIIRNARAAT